MVEEVGGEQLICEHCEQPFLYSDAERRRDAAVGYPPPRACPTCIRERRAAGAAKRAAKRPRTRNYRR